MVLARGQQMLQNRQLRVQLQMAVRQKLRKPQVGQLPMPSQMGALSVQPQLLGMLPQKLLMRCQAA